LRLVLFGANGPTGRLATGMAVAEGHTVTAVTRRPEAFPLRLPGLTVAGADVLDAQAVNRVVADHDAVISTLGVPYTREPVTVFSRGTANIVDAMTGHGVRRLVCVTSMGVSAQTAPGDGFIFRKVIAPILLAMGRTIYEDMRRMEAIVRDSDLDWTVIRPAGLFDATTVTNYRAAPERLTGMFTSRADLADALLREATEDRNVGRWIDVVTTEGVPRYARVFLREALHIGK
jgi:putative NADH-flavin reductase